MNGWEIGSEKRGQNNWEHQGAEKTNCMKRKIHKKNQSQTIKYKIEKKVRERETVEDLDKKKK